MRKGWLARRDGPRPIAIPDRTDRDEVVVTRRRSPRRASLSGRGHWHPSRGARPGPRCRVLQAPRSRSRSIRMARQRPPRDPRENGLARTVTVEEAARRIPDSRSSISTLRGSEPAISRHAPQDGRPNLVLEVRLTGIRPDDLDLDTTEVEEQLDGSFLRARVRDSSIRPVPPAASHRPIDRRRFIRDVEARIAELEADPANARAARRRSCATSQARPAAAGGHEVTLCGGSGPSARMRITSSASGTPRYREFEVPLAPPDDIPVRTRPARPRSAGARAILTKKATSNAAEMERPPIMGRTARGPPSDRHRVRDRGRGAGIQRGSIEKAFAARKGTVRLEIGGEVITDPTLADQALAE